MITAIDESRIKYWEELSETANAIASNCSKLLKNKGKVYGNVIDGGRLWSTEYTIVVSTDLSDRDDVTRLEQVDPYLAQNLLVNLAAEFPQFTTINDWRELRQDNMPKEMVDKLRLVARRRTFKECCDVSRSWESSPASNILADVLSRFLASRPKPREGTRGTRDGFYGVYLPKSIPILGLRPTPSQIDSFVKSRDCKPGGQAAYFRAIRAFFNWLHSPASDYSSFKPEDNPVQWLKCPKVPEQDLPAQTEESVAILLSKVKNLRDKAIIATYIESGARLSEVAEIHESDIIWDKRQIRVIAKGGNEVHYVFHEVAEGLLRDWLTEYHPNGGSIWGISKNGIVTMLRRLEKHTGVKCNPHSFRRGFASIERDKGVDSLDIMKLGNWRSLSMVLRYTKSIDFDNSQKRYKAPLGGLADSTNGLPKDAVPRPRIELGTRGFSVRCSTN